MVSKRKTVAFCIPNMIIGGVETVFCSTIDELSNSSDLKIQIITHAQIREPLYADWLKMHPELSVYVYYPLCNWFEDIAPRCRGILKPLRKIAFSLYKKYRRAVVFLSRRFTNVDIFIDYKNMEFFKELRQEKGLKIGWFHSAISYCEKNNLFTRLPIYDKIVCITDGFYNEFKEKIPSRLNDIVRIYNFVNPVDIQNKALSGQKSSEKYFCHVSRLTEGKDLKTVFDAFEIFAKQHRDFKLFIIGDGPKASDFKKYASKLKSAKQIVFLGSMDNPFGLMQGAVANILSSEHEGFGMVLVESMALKVPIISSNYYSSANEILENGQNGWLFDIGNAGMLSKCLSDVILNPEKTKKVVKRAYASLERFDLKRTYKQIEDLLFNE